MDEMANISDFCSCRCHTKEGKNLMHFFACCSKCPYCRNHIKDGRFKLHKEYCVCKPKGK